MKRENEIITILGKKGGGKTSLAANLTNDCNRLIIFDYNREYQRGLVVSTPTQLAKELQKYYESAFRIIYRPDDSILIDEHFEFFSRIAYAMNNYTLLIEEIDLVSSSNFMTEGLQKIINYGRHKGISLIGLSRRAFKVPRDLTSNSDKVMIAGPLNEPRDIKYLAEFMDTEDAEKVRNLKREEGKGSEFLVWSTDGVYIGKINFLTKEVQFNNLVPSKNLTEEPKSPEVEK